MKITPTALPDVLILEPRVFKDTRGHFFESYNHAAFRKATGVDVEFVQDNQSRSAKGVLRGLHYQIEQPQGKLVRVAAGVVFDVAVDLRAASATFGQWVGAELSAANFRQIWIPAGFAHGFLVLSDAADLIYKTTDYYAPAHERCLRWDDPQVGVAWPLEGIEPLLSAKDLTGASLEKAERFDMPRHTR
jgi:dTDP-4-dehydrorhamnose 3,5-epimerase